MKLLSGDMRPRRCSPLSRATRMPLKCAQGRTLKSILDGVEDADQRDRLWQAVRMDNRGTWFLCKSHWTVAQLERRFSEELVASILYERIGGMLQGEKPYIYMQIALMQSTLQKLHPDSEPEWVEVPTEGNKPSYDVVTGLKELQIAVVRLVPDILNVIESGRY